MIHEDGTVEVSTDVEASPATVFGFLSDPARLSQWLGAAAEMEPHPGGLLRVRFDRFGTVVEGRVVELVPPRRAVFTWGVASGPQAATLPPGSTRVTVELEPIPGGTRVTLRHEGLPDEKERTEHEGGWRYYAGQIALHASRAERGAGVERAVGAWFEAWAEPDDARRAALLATCATEDISFEDEHASLSGLAALTAHVGQVQSLLPGLLLRRRGGVQIVRGWLRFGWDIAAKDGLVIASGENVGELGAGERIRRLAGFTDIA
jgi:uncharacterized protein YndB with AHSA1/START domain